MVLLLLPKFDSGRDLVYNLLKQNVMAKSENVIRGRIGNMIFYRVRGVTRIRSVPLSAVRPDALKCRTARLRLIAAAGFTAFAGYPVTGYLAAGGQRYGDERV